MKIKGMKSVIGMLLSAGIIFSMIPAGSMISPAAEIQEGKSGTEKTAAYDRMDFSSCRLIIRADKSIIRDPAHCLANYEDVYLLQYDTSEEAENAYRYYHRKAVSAEPDAAAAAAADPSAGDRSGTGKILVTEAGKTGEQNPSAEKISKVACSGTMTSEINPLKELEKESGKKTEKGVAFHPVIALIDSGVPADACVISRASMLGGAGGDDNGHGTQMLESIKKMDPDAQVMSVKALDSSGTGTVSSLYAAIRYAIEKKADIINLSLSAYCNEESGILESVIREACEKGITVVGAAGNDNRDAADYIPGCIKEAVITGACDADGEKLQQSNYGLSVDYYLNAQSTSQAAAFMSGYIASHTRFGFVDYKEAEGLIFVRSYTGKSDANAAYRHLPVDKTKAARIKYTFIDSEKLEGTTLDSVIEKGQNVRLSGQVDITVPVYQKENGDYVVLADAPYLNGTAQGNILDYEFTRGNNFGKVIREGVSLDRKSGAAFIKKEAMPVMEEGDFANLTLQVLVPVNPDVSRASVEMTAEDEKGRIRDKTSLSFAYLAPPVFQIGKNLSADRIGIYLNGLDSPLDTSAFSYDAETGDVFLQMEAAGISGITVKTDSRQAVKVRASASGRKKTAFYIKWNGDLEKDDWTIKQALLYPGFKSSVAGKLRNDGVLLEAPTASRVADSDLIDMLEKADSRMQYRSQGSGGTAGRYDRNAMVTWPKVLRFSSGEADFHCLKENGEMYTDKKSGGSGQKSQFVVTGFCYHIRTNAKIDDLFNDGDYGRAPTCFKIIDVEDEDDVRYLCVAWTTVKPISDTDVAHIGQASGSQIWVAMKRPRNPQTGDFPLNFVKIIRNKKKNTEIPADGIRFHVLYKDTESGDDAIPLRKGSYTDEKKNEGKKEAKTGKHETREWIFQTAGGGKINLNKPEDYFVSGSSFFRYKAKGESEKIVFWPGTYEVWEDSASAIAVDPKVKPVKKHYIGTMSYNTDETKAEFKWKKGSAPTKNRRLTGGGKFINPTDEEGKTQTYEPEVTTTAADLSTHSQAGNTSDSVTIRDTVHFDGFKNDKPLTIKAEMYDAEDTDTPVMTVTRTLQRADQPDRGWKITARQKRYALFTEYYRHWYVSGYDEDGNEEYDWYTDTYAPRRTDVTPAENVYGEGEVDLEFELTDPADYAGKSVYISVTADGTSRGEDNLEDGQIQVDSYSDWNADTSRSGDLQAGTNPQGHAEHDGYADETEWIDFPEIGTTASDDNSTDHVGTVGEKITITDTVSYSNLRTENRVAGKIELDEFSDRSANQYQMRGYLVYKQSGEKYIQPSGEAVRADSGWFVPREPDGSTAITFTFDSTAAAAKDLTVYEELYVRSPDGTVTKIAEHKEKMDAEERELQTLHFPEIKTLLAYNDLTGINDRSAGMSGRKDHLSRYRGNSKGVYVDGRKLTSDGKAASEADYLTFTDHVECRNLIKGHTYILEATLHAKNSLRGASGGDGGAIAGKYMDENGRVAYGTVKGRCEFVAEGSTAEDKQQKETHDVEIVFDSNYAPGTMLVAYEDLKVYRRNAKGEETGKESDPVAVHHDITDQDQSIQTVFGLHLFAGGKGTALFYAAALFFAAGAVAVLLRRYAMRHVS